MLDINEVQQLHDAVVYADSLYKDFSDTSTLFAIAVNEARYNKWNYRPYNADAYAAVKGYFGLTATHRNKLDASEWYQYVMDAAHAENWALAAKFLKIAKVI